jgi:hypothetical protein
VRFLAWLQIGWLPVRGVIAWASLFKTDLVWLLWNQAADKRLGCVVGRVGNRRVPESVDFDWGVPDMRSRLKTILVATAGAGALCTSVSAIAAGDTHRSAPSAAVIDLFQTRTVS